MTLNAQQVITRIREISADAVRHQQRLDDLYRHARDLLEEWADRNEDLREKVESARQQDQAMRCALPVSDRLDAHFAAGRDITGLTLIAADGSHIAPDRHASMLYCLVNVGAVVMQAGSGRAPVVCSDSRLLFGDEIFKETGLLSAEAVEQQRDIAERSKLLELAKDVEGSCVALTDGPVELWGSRNDGAGEYRRNVEIHASILSQLHARGVIAAGYVDKPGADLVVRSLELTGLPVGHLNKRNQSRTLRGVNDRRLFEGILKRGERSAVFEMQSASRLYYAGDLMLHFCYLNVGSSTQPSVVRLEFPRWVAESKQNLELLQAALVEQCRIMGGRPYPYILHRAHEAAAIGYEERRQVEALLEIELRRAGSRVEEISNKQSLKNLPGRKR